jgi:hypothetical protein
VREIARLILQWTLRHLESDRPDQAVAAFDYSGERYRRNRRTIKTIDTCFGSVTFERWFYQNVQPGSPGLAPLDVRLGLSAQRVTPALAEVTGRVAADMPQQAVRSILAERFGVQPGIGTLRRIIADIATEVRTEHDDVAIAQLCQWVEQARSSEGNQDVVLQVGRDGVFVQTRPCWEEASCGTIAVHDRSGNRLGTIYLGQMPESEQLTMTARLTKVITGVLREIGDEVPTLRYVTDAGCHPQAYFRDVLSVMKHPVTGKSLSWSWGVDFYHACEYVSKLAGALFGVGSEQAQSWAATQRKTLREIAGGVSQVIRRAAQQKRRGGLTGPKSDYTTSINYLKKYRKHMDFAERRKRGEPIGSGITEAGCKVIFNQRLKQSGMRWHRSTGQHIVDLRTAQRSGIWTTIWTRLIGKKSHLPPITTQNFQARTKKHERFPLPA